LQPNHIVLDGLPLHLGAFLDRQRVHQLRRDNAEQGSERSAVVLFLISAVLDHIPEALPLELHLITIAHSA
jgi:hypothetical protein